MTNENRVASDDVSTSASEPAPAPGAPSGAHPGGPGRARGRWAVTALIIGIAMLALVASMLWFSFDRLTSLWPFGDTEAIDRSGGAVLLTLEDLSEFRAATGTFQVIIDIERDVAVVPAEIAGERVLFIAQGSVDASVDFSSLNPGTVRIDEEQNRAFIDLPHAELGDADVDPEQSYVFERQRGLLDRLGGVFSDNPTSERELYIAAEAKLADAATESELIQQAETNTTAMLQGLLGSLGFTEVTVNYGS